MNKKKKLIIVFTGVVLAVAIGGAAWWFTEQNAVGEKKEGVIKKPAKYITLDKVVLMLSRNQEETKTHYLLTDLVLTSTEEKAHDAKEHLPLLRSITVRTLSGYTFQEASNMTVEQFTNKLNKTFNEVYAKERMEKPFSEVMIGKLVIE
jgi:flagellar FliL protein